MILIFAKKGTKQKIAIEGGSVRPNRKKVQMIMTALKQQYGGQWLCCDTLNEDEILVYSDKKTYKGYEAGVTRYTTIAEILGPPTIDGVQLQPMPVRILGSGDEVVLQMLATLETDYNNLTLATLILDGLAQDYPMIAARLEDLRTKTWSKEEYDRRFNPESHDDAS